MQKVFYLKNSKFQICDVSGVKTKLQIIEQYDIKSLDGNHVSEDEIESVELVAGEFASVEKGTFIKRNLAEYFEILLTYKDKRRNEYPPMADYLDGIVKGDQAQIDKYIADCLAVKAKYPKP